MSQISQMSTQSQDSSGVCFPLAKYSSYHGRDTKGTGKLPYKHVVHPDLKVHIQNVRIIDGQGNYAVRVFFKVTTGVEVLISADLGDILACYRRFNPSLANENAVRVAIRAPSYLAMIYPTPDGNSQRFQLNVLNTADFEKVVSIFHDLGFETTQSAPLSKANSSIPSRIDTSSAPPSSMYSASSRVPSPANSALRPASAMRSSPLSHQISFGHGTFKLPPIPEVSNSDLHRQASGLPISKSYNTSSAQSTAMVPRVETLKYGLDLNRSSSMHISQMDKEAAFDQASVPVPPPFESSQSNDVVNSQGLSLPDERLNIQRYPEQQETRQYTSSPFFNTSREAQPDRRPSSTVPVSRLRQEMIDVDDVFTSPPTVIRPMSAPVDKSVMQDLLMPPKRTLPFVPLKKRVSSIADLPPLPKPTPIARSESVIRPPILPGMTVDTPAKKPVNKRIAQRKAAVQSAPVKPIIPAADPESDGTSVVPEPVPTLSQGEVSPLAAKSASRRPTSAAAVLETKATSTRKRTAPTQTAPATKRSKMVDQGTQTDLHSDKVAQTPENTRPPGDLITPPEDYLQAIDNFVTNHRARPPPRELYNTPEYRDASQEERDIMVNNFICENLQNPNFIQLCKDAENSWRRIGLGM